jgi:hypothetical protein
MPISVAYLSNRISMFLKIRCKQGRADHLNLLFHSTPLYARSAVTARGMVAIWGIMTALGVICLVVRSSSKILLP